MWVISIIQEQIIDNSITILFGSLRELSFAAAQTSTNKPTSHNHGRLSFLNWSFEPTDTVQCSAQKMFNEENQKAVLHPEHCNYCVIPQFLFLVHTVNTLQTPDSLSIFFKNVPMGESSRVPSSKTRQYTLARDTAR